MRSFINCWRQFSSQVSPSNPWKAAQCLRCRWWTWQWPNKAASWHLETSTDASSCALDGGSGGDVSCQVVINLVRQQESDGINGIMMEPKYENWLVVWNIFPFWLIFFRGVAQPPTRKLRFLLIVPEIGISPLVSPQVEERWRQQRPGQWPLMRESPSHPSPRSWSDSKSTSFW